MRLEDLKGIVDIDGAYGSGGGQILRTSLALSLLTRRPFRLTNIRLKRKNPGLAAQHLACVNVAQELSEAYVRGNEIGSKEVLFMPKKFSAKELKVDIGTAGSTVLVLQMLMPCLIEVESFKAEITGGTDVANAPSVDYLRYVLLPLLEKIGYKAKVEVVRRGFYPKGGGVIVFEKLSGKLNENFEGFAERGKLQRIKGMAVASKGLEVRKVADKIASFTLQWLKSTSLAYLEADIKKEYCEAFGDGAVLTLWLETEKSVLGASVVGERQKPSEVVAREAVFELESEISGAIDKHAADQVLPFLAYLAIKQNRTLSLKTSSISDHAKTNAFVIEKFLPVKFEIDEDKALIKVKPS
jgi:RNA 3'-phosphate cyclase